MEINMEKIKLIADTASDIPDEALQRYNIDMPCVPIVVDGKEYVERQSFGIREFYRILSDSKEIPVTSRVPVEDFLRCYEDAYSRGYTDVICVTINAGASGTNASAQMARLQFYDKKPEAQAAMRINVIDSRTYSMAYGYPVIQAAKKAEEGVPAAAILEYLEDWFSRVEILLGLYTLEYARKSGRIGAAAAFVGDILGVRPIIAMIDGETKTVDKVRGERNLVPRIAANCKQLEAEEVLVVVGAEDERADELKAQLKKEMGVEPPVYNLGASIVINSGPRCVAAVYLGKKRRSGHRG